VIRATAPAAIPRPTVRNASARRPALLSLLLMTVLALVGTAAVGQRADAAELYRDDIWVSVDGVAFERGSESDEVAYVVRPVGSRNGGRAYSRDLSRDEQNNGWAAFWEARQAFPDGYCVVWVEVEDASNWHESEGSTACNAEEPAPAPAKPTPTPTATKNTEPTQAATPKPAQPPAPEPASSPTPKPAPAETVAPTPTPSPTPKPSPTPSATASSTPSPSPSHASPEAALLREIQRLPTVRPQADVAEQDDVISPLGWVAVLGSGTLLTTGGVLMLWRRFT